MVNSLSDIVEGSEPQQLATGYVFTEGPLWHPDGYWLFVDIRQSLIIRLAPGGQPAHEREDSNESNGLTFDLQGRLVMCEGGARRVTRREPDGSITVVADRYDGKRLNRPNDVIGRSDGTLYFTDPGGRLEAPEREIDCNGVYSVSPDGSVSLLIDDFELPNGLAFSPDETTLYVANTRAAMEIRAFDVAADGSVSGGRLFAEFASDEPDGVPDGMKVDVDGRVYCTGPGGHWVFDSDGAHIGTIRLPELPANCAWGGPDNKTMLFTARTSVYSLEMKTAGTRTPMKD
ncbi:MAG: SMP-30/gluconolactonase/LRE family protein [SAR202 cluster bacterium]|jgi:gluconolactonase|nr:gluconolactonase [Chloroflexota bacterium]MDP6419803.1 SMP-30/gluconolactonase/LRE family protein [SAR202 cluster bacterium]HAL46536.1 gluconolactonase [Dehalococcoidia bacterium]MDP6662586.1 SMP-30/gluconolactonase/LRE family protein [SAR202 cluster bacterium]MDP6798406.1 SMP-30/gluconolactonase/LRE family protein [SAR202 cluster bacterium]|tara:strand:+ start:3785 stop:4648 length:864 start_codon:yes stop_codon:yes gene_type:complete